MKKIEAVTYSLAPEGTGSAEYYRDVAALADRIIGFAGAEIIPAAESYVEYALKFGLGEPREITEYVFELLSFGVLWRSYAATALAVRKAPFLLMANLGSWRKKYQRLKPGIDLLRGIIITLRLLPETGRKELPADPGLGEIDKVCLWFEATGEFREESFRFVRWRAYFEYIGGEKRKQLFDAIGRFAEWFESASLVSLGKYTANVDSFAAKKNGAYRWREDRISCLKARLEYHLNMAGAELLNRAFRKEYLLTNSETVLLPGCMRLRSADNCGAVREAKGLKCTGCEPGCRVNQIRLKGIPAGRAVYVIPHATDLSLWAPDSKGPKMGIVASACVPTLVEGGLELRRYGIPAQCVPLDCSGCAKHWLTEGTPTSLSRAELERRISRDPALN